MRLSEKTLLLELPGSCNQDCLFCFAGDCKSRGMKDESRVRAEIDKARGEGYDTILFAGGEPTTYPSLSRMLEWTNKRGMEYCLFTNGMRFASKSYTGSIFECAPHGSVMVTLYSHLPEVHDYLTQVPGSHSKTVRGIRNILRHYPALIVTTVAVGANYAGLPEMALSLEKAGVRGFKVSGMVATDEVMVSHRDLVVNFADLRKPLGRTLDIAAARGMKMFVDKIPFCINAKHRDRFIPEWNRNPFVEAEVCGVCRVNQVCPGVEKGAWEIFGPPPFLEAY